MKQEREHPGWPITSTLGPPTAVTRGVSNGLRFGRLSAAVVVPPWIIIFLAPVRDLSTVILLYSAKSKVLSVLNYELWASGRMESAFAIGLVTTLIVIIAAIAARLLGSRQELN